jgi:hypothetical protein
MGRRECQHTCVLVLIIFVLLLANGLVVWFRFIKRGKN